jgi:Sap, sulfolipid-1-addressing protein
MGQVVLLSLTASLNPTLVAATTVMLLLDKPSRLMLGYLLGAYMTSITLGLVIVFSLSDSSASNTTENTISPAVDIALGGIALAAAFVLYTGRYERRRETKRARKAEKPDKGPPRWQRELSKGSARTTFIVGALLTPWRVVPRRPPRHPRPEVLDDRNRAAGDRLQPGDALAARGSTRVLCDRSRLDTACPRAI